MPLIELPTALERIRETLDRLAKHDPNRTVGSSDPATCESEFNPICGVESVPTSDAYRRVVFSDVVAPFNHPPFDQSLRDGVAIRRHDHQSPNSSSSQYLLVGKTTAGQFPDFELGPGQASIVMTGAPVPKNTDAVVMAEQVRWIEDTKQEGNLPNRIQETNRSLWSGSDQAKSIEILANPKSDCCGEALKEDQLDRRFVMSAGSFYKTGQTLIRTGTSLNPQAIALAASANVPSILCYRKPRVSILVSGDEILPVGSPIKPGAIYNSNGPQIKSLVKRFGGEVVACDQIPDDRGQLESWISESLKKSDMIITTGGVSVGTKDLLPSAFTNCGVQNVFHGVKMKPGKPIWFGFSEEADNKAFVFGLPGNPLGAFAGFHLFVRPVLHQLSGGHSAENSRTSNEENGTDKLSAETHLDQNWCRIRLSGRYYFPKGGRPVFWPGKVIVSQSSPCDPFNEDTSVQSCDHTAVKMMDWKGSGDLNSVSESNCLVYVDPQRQSFPDDGYLEDGTILPCLIL